MKPATKVFVALGLGAAGVGLYLAFRPKSAAAHELPHAPPGTVSDETLKDQAVMTLASPVPTPGGAPDFSALRSAEAFFAAHGGADGLTAYRIELERLLLRAHSDPNAKIAYGRWWSAFNQAQFGTGEVDLLESLGYVQVAAVLDWYAVQTAARASARVRDRALDLIRQTNHGGFKRLN